MLNLKKRFLRNCSYDLSVAGPQTENITKNNRLAIVDIVFIFIYSLFLVRQRN